MRIRYVLGMPPDATPRDVAHAQQMFKEILKEPGWQDIVVSHGMTVTKLDTPKRKFHHEPRIIRWR